MFDNVYAVVIITLVVLVLVVTALFAAFYRRASKDESYVRTGFGGELVVLNNGSFVLPVLHDTVPINMQTLRVEISRSEKAALITKDPLRVDVVAEFYLRVEPTEAAIATAARTMGRRTMDTEQMRDIVEAQCVAALRSVASTMTLDELHENRKDFEHNVEEAVNKEFRKNGLELVSVSLMRLDQTPRDFFDENNAFDARGLIRLDEITEESRKRRNDIEQDNNIRIQEKNKEAEQRRLSIEQQTIESKKQQELYIADLNSRTMRDIEELKLQSEREIEEIRIAKTVAIEMATRDMEVARAEFERSFTEAWMETDRILAESARLKEEISTAREKAEAERKKLVELISAQKEAQRQVTIAEANAEVERLAARAAELRYQVEAAGKSALNEASNLLSNEQISMQVKMEIVRQLPQVIRESVRPLENIDGIKIMHLEGLGGLGAGGSSRAGSGSSGRDGGGGGGSLSDQVVDSALRYRAQVPLIDALLQEVDLKGDSAEGLTRFLRDEVQDKRSRQEQREQAAAVLARNNEARDGSEALDEQD
ncbi:MAG: band 7 protein [Thiothrix sp.]|nr:band 7 protein [Thiothrix sp.]